jgi:glutathione S-transferase
MKITLKHFKTGSHCPPIEQDKLRIYSMRYCPFAQRTRLVLAHKNIPHELVNVNLQYKPEWFLVKNPLGLVPVLEQNGQIIYESAICNDYLDEVYPENKLTPDDPYEKAQMKILMERFGKVVTHYYTVLRNQAAISEHLPNLHNSYELFENALKGKFFGGDNLNMLDIHMWPFFEKLEFYAEHQKLDLAPAEKFPKLNEWRKSMQATETCQQADTPMEYYPQILKSYATPGAEKPYDLGLE